MLRKSVLRYDNAMGFSFPDISAIISDPKLALKAVTSQIEQSVSSSAQDILPESLYDKASELAAKQGASIASSLEAKATDFIMAKAGEYAGQKTNQDNAITSGVNAMANQFSQGLIDIKDSWRSGTFTTKYKMPLMIGSSVLGLLFFRKAITGLVLKPKKLANPRKRKASKRRK